MVTEKGLELIKKFEGFVPSEYVCPAGKRTIGYGHVVRETESFPPELTEREAEELLKEDLGAAEEAVIRFVDVPLTPNQFDALVSFVFNVGAGRFERSMLLRRLNAGDYAGAAKEFLQWVYGNGQKLEGLVRRRRAEKALFETND